MQKRFPGGGMKLFLSACSGRTLEHASFQTGRSLAKGLIPLQPMALFVEAGCQTTTEYSV